MNDAVAMIRRGWLSVAYTVAPNVTALGGFLESRLDAAESANNVSEDALLAVVDEAAQMAVEAGSGDVAHVLSTRLRRTVYEYLLALDAVIVPGVESVAATEGRPPGPPGSASTGDPPGREAFESPPAAGEAPARAAAPGYVAPKGGFHIADPADVGEVAGPARSRDAPPASEHPPAPPPVPEVAAGEATHDRGPIEFTSSPVPVAPAGADAAPPPPPPRARPDTGAGWQIRDSADWGTGSLPAEAAGGSPPEPQVDLTEARRNVDDKLRRKRCDEAGALLQGLAQDVGGRAVAELALDAGDRCRGLGKRMAATSCYLAASRSDPLFEQPLARLADVCIDDQDIDLAVSYLERIARLTRLRGDSRGALRIYRKIVTLAPYREDMLDVLMRAETTGRLDP